MNNNRKLPIGIQDFEDLRLNDYLYVDKTAYLYRIVKMGKPYFLGRPRRFGKSLLLSTLKAYFLGKKELFKGLAIADLEKDWIKYPVFYIDFNAGIYTDVNSIYERIDANLKYIEEEWDCITDIHNPAIRFEAIIKRVNKKTGLKVVVLVDEYDKPLLSTMDDPKLNDEIRKVLKGFYGVLKSTDADLRFVFLTGVTKFSKVSIFSDLNHLQDISMDEQFSGICGISEKELLQNFQPELQALAEKRMITKEKAFAEMKRRYDGYHFAKVSEDMYNPFSVLNTFAKLDFMSYWFQTGTPTFLVNMLKEEDFEIPNLENNIYISADAVMDYRVEQKNPVPLLYQSGYLTIKEYNEEYDEYTLGFPNEEVKYGFLNELLPAFVPAYANNQNFSAVRFVKALRAGKIEEFMTIMTAFYASIPYDSITGKKDERYYQFIFYLLFSLMGQVVETEVKGATGRADAVVKTADTVFVFEFKMDESATAEQALAQIDEKGYSIPYSAGDKKVVKIGVEFSIEEHGIKRWLKMDA